MSVITINQENFESIINSGKTVLIDFYADWCGPCKMMAPIVEEIAEEIADITVGKINVDSESSLAAKFGIMTIPTFVVIKDGEITNQISGAMPKKQLTDAIGV